MSYISHVEQTFGINMTQEIVDDVVKLQEPTVIISQTTKLLHGAASNQIT